MPYKPQCPCRYPKCPNTVTRGQQGYCDKHKSKRFKKNTDAKRLYDRQRKTSNERGYNYQWQRLRQSILERDIICQECRKDICTEVHHIVPISRGGEETEDNLLGLCKRCHSKITRKK